MGGVGIVESNPNHEPAGSSIGGQFARGGASGNIVDSPAFKAWFGDSKVVDEHGRPLVVYHGTSDDVPKFDAEFSNSLGFHFGDAKQANYFTSEMQGEGAVLPVYLRMEHPLRIDSDIEFDDQLVTAKGLLAHGGITRDDYSLLKPLLDGGFTTRAQSFRALTQAVKTNGYDGIIYPNLFEGGGRVAYAVFDATQVKSIFNKGTFKSYDPRISEAGVLQEAAGSSGLDDLLQADDEAVYELANELSLPPEAVTLQIDRALDTKVWNGADFEDRSLHSASVITRDLVTEMERSLMQQENYSEFSERMLGYMGVDEPKASGVLGGLIRQLEGEARLAWNEAMISAHQGGDTALVWESELSATTTPECWAAHGELLIHLSITIPAHWGCKCLPRTIPNPDSTDLETAEAGQAIQEEMRAERDSG